MCSPYLRASKRFSSHSFFLVHQHKQFIHFIKNLFFHSQQTSAVFHQQLRERLAADFAFPDLMEGFRVALVQPAGHVRIGPTGAVLVGGVRDGLIAVV